MLDYFTPLDELLNIQEEYFIPTFKQVYLDKMRSKFGLFNELKEDIDNVPNDQKLVDTFLNVLEATGGDLTNAFRNLNLVKNINDEQLVEKEINNYIDLMIKENSLTFEEMQKESKKSFQSLNVQYCLQLMEDSPENFKLLKKTSEKIKAFLNLIDRYDKTKEMTMDEKIQWDKEKWKDFFNLYLQRIKYDLKDKKTVDDKVLESRISLMNANNAKFILRNHLIQKAIEEAEIGNNDEIKRLIYLIEHPFDEINDKSISNLKSYYRMAKKGERCKQITCSS